MRFRVYFFTLASVFLVSLFFRVTPAHAQLDTEYWMPPLWLPLDPGDPGYAEKLAPTELIITTPYATANVRVTQADGTLVAEGVAEPGNPFVVSLSDDATDPSDVIGMTYEANTRESDKGLRITADEPIQVVHRNTSLFNQSLSPLKGQRALGTNFWVGSQTRVSDLKYGKDDIHFVSVMATEDDTQITFVAPDSDGSFDTDGPDPDAMIMVTLNKNETYLVRNSDDATPTESAFGVTAIRGNNNTKNLAGTHVIATKPIAVMGGGQHLIFEGNGGDNAEAGIDQIVPVASDGVPMIGSQYIVVRGGTQLAADPAADDTDYVIIIATEDATTVSVNGTAVGTFDAGDPQEFTLPGGRNALGTPYYIEGNKDFYLYHVSGLVNHELGMSAVPTVDCAGSRYISFNRFNNPAFDEYDNAMHIIARTATFESLLINEQAYDEFLSSPNLRELSGPGGESWSTLTFDYQTDFPDNLRISADDVFHVGVVAGGGEVDGVRENEGGTYGYLSNFARNVDVLDPNFADLEIPTTIYTVGEVPQGEATDHCLELRSCGTDHQIDNLVPSDNTGQTTISEDDNECLRYVAQPGYVGNDTITVFVSNDEGLTGQVQLVFEVVANPIAVADTFTVAQGESVSDNVLDNDRNVEAGEAAELITDVSNGEVTLNPDGTFTYTPEPEFTGTDSLVYQICDNRNPDVCSQATVLFPVIGEDGLISAEDSLYTLDRNTSLNDNLTTNVNNPSRQGVVFTTDPLSGPANGTLDLNPDGTFTYIPAEDFFGRDSVVYEVCLEGDPTQCAQATAFFLVVIPEDDSTDSDNDGLPDVIEVGDDQENPIDSDDDDIPDYLDPDSDNDSIPDVVEVADNDGNLDDPNNPEDTDDDGTPDYLDLDSDNDDRPDEEEAGSDPTNPQDTDDDGIPDYRDTDRTIRVYDGVSPGGANPTWIIEGIRAFPQNNVKVYNRWGNIVFEVDGYDNNDRVWWGNANVSNLGDSEVPDGTYFYIIDLGEGDEPETGYVIVNR